MSQQSKYQIIILPTLTDYSLLTDETLQWEIQNCLIHLEYIRIDVSYVPQMSAKEYQQRIELAEQELERRYLLS